MFRLVNIPETIGYGFDMMNEWKKITERNVDFESDLCTSCVTFWLPSNRVGNNAGVNAGVNANDRDICILETCRTPKSRREIFDVLGVIYHMKNYKAFIEPLVNNGFIELTIPEKPKSPNQKFVITEKGKYLLTLLKK